MDIPKFILEKSRTNGFDFYYYLHIKGGSGIKPWRTNNRYGGEFDFIVFYASPAQMEGCDICERIWCIENKIKFGEGTSIEEAYKKYLKKCKNKFHAHQ